MKRVSFLKALMVFGVFLLRGFQASAQYVSPEVALDRLSNAVEQVKFSDYSWTSPTSNGTALFHPAKLEKVYLEAVQVRIKATDNVSTGMTQGHSAYVQKVPQQVDWVNQWRQEVDALLRN